jgi:hypothetical protein
VYWPHLARTHSSICLRSSRIIDTGIIRLLILSVRISYSPDHKRSRLCSSIRRSQLRPVMLHTTRPVAYLHSTHRTPKFEAVIVALQAPTSHFLLIESTTRSVKPLSHGFTRNLGPFASLWDTQLTQTKPATSPYLFTWRSSRMHVAASWTRPFLHVFLRCLLCTDDSKNIFTQPFNVHCPAHLRPEAVVGFLY